MPLARPGRPTRRARARPPRRAGAPPAPPAPPPPAPAAPGPTAAPAADTALTTLRGALVHHPLLPGAKSVHAFTGAEFFLVTDDRGELVLRPTDAVDDAALRALAGQQVTVEATESQGEAPRPDESYPIGPDGQPMRRGAGWKVRSIRPGT